MKYSFRFVCKSHGWILAFIWIIGLLSGAFVSYSARPYIVSLMRAVSGCRVSIVWLAVCNIFSLLLIAFAIHFSIPVIAECILLFRSVSCGYVMIGLLTVFGSGGWLIALFLLFSAGLINVLLLWLYLYREKGRSSIYASRITVGVSTTLVITVIDYLYIAPFLVRILDHF